MVFQGSVEPGCSGTSTFAQCGTAPWRSATLESTMSAYSRNLDVKVVIKRHRVSWSSQLWRHTTASNAHGNALDHATERRRNGRCSPLV